MHHDLARLIVDAALEFNPHPAVAFVATAIALRHHRVGKGKEGSVIAPLLSESLHIEIELAVEHRLQPATRDIPLRMPINGVAHFHVVSRHALGDGSSRAAHAKEPTHYLLACSNLSECPVPARIEIDLQCLRMGINNFLFHLAQRLLVPSGKREIFVLQR